MARQCCGVVLEVDLMVRRHRGRRGVVAKHHDQGRQMATGDIPMSGNRIDIAKLPAIARPRRAGSPLAIYQADSGGGCASRRS